MMMPANYSFVFYAIEWMWLFIPYAENCRKKENVYRFFLSAITVLLSAGTMHLLSVTSKIPDLSWYVQYLSSNRTGSGFFVAYLLDLFCIFLYFIIVLKRGWKFGLYCTGVHMLFTECVALASVVCSMCLFSAGQSANAVFPVFSVIGILCFRKTGRIYISDTDTDVLTVIVWLFALSMLKMFNVFFDSHDYLLALASFVMPVLIVELIQNHIIHGRYERWTKQIQTNVELMQADLDILLKRDMQKTGIRYHVEQILQMFERGDRAEAENTLRHVQEQYSGDKSFCGNSYVNALLRYYSDRDPSFRISSKAVIDDNCGINGMDLCVILFTVINALYKAENTFVGLNIMQIENLVYIKLETVKAGLGYTDLQLVQHIVNMYDGVINCSDETGVITIALTDFNYPLKEVK